MKVALALLLAASPFAGPWRHTIYQISAKLDGKWCLSFLRFFLLNYESYTIEILNEDSPCITLGRGPICRAMVAYYLQNFTQIGQEMGFKLFELVSS